MKKLINATLLMLIVFLFIPNMVLNAQFECSFEGLSSSFGYNPLQTTILNQACSLSDLTEQEKAMLPDVIIHVNIHFIGTDYGNFQPYEAGSMNYENPDSGNRLAKLIINKANEYLSNIIPGTISLASFTGDAKYRFELYTEDSNQDDLYNGVWYWNNEPYPANSPPYGEKVINIIFDNETEYDDELELLVPVTAQKAIACNSYILCNRIYYYNYYNNIFESTGMLLFIQ